MPSKSEKQRRFMGAELARKRAGKETRTNMSEDKLEDFASKEFVMKDALEFIDNYIKKDDIYISGLGEVPINETKPIRRVRRVHQTEPSDEVIRQRIKEGGRDAYDIASGATIGMGSRLTGKELRHRKRKNPTHQEMTREKGEWGNQRFHKRGRYATVEEGSTWSPYTEEDTVDTSQRVAANRATSQQRVKANAAASQERVKANEAASSEYTSKQKLNYRGAWVEDDTPKSNADFNRIGIIESRGVVENAKKRKQKADAEAAQIAAYGKFAKTKSGVSKMNYKNIMSQISKQINHLEKQDDLVFSGPLIEEARAENAKKEAQTDTNEARRTAYKKVNALSEKEREGEKAYQQALSNVTDKDKKLMATGYPSNTRNIDQPEREAMFASQLDKHIDSLEKASIPLPDVVVQEGAIGGAEAAKGATTRAATGAAEKVGAGKQRMDEAIHRGKQSTKRGIGRAVTGFLRGKKGLASRNKAESNEQKRRQQFDATLRGQREKLGYTKSNDKPLSSKDLLPTQDENGNFVPNNTIPFTPETNELMSLAADAISTYIKDSVDDNYIPPRAARRNKKEASKRKMKVSGAGAKGSQRMIGIRAAKARGESV